MKAVTHSDRSLSIDTSEGVHHSPWHPGHISGAVRRLARQACPLPTTGTSSRGARALRLHNDCSHRCGRPDRRAPAAISSRPPMDST